MMEDGQHRPASDTGWRGNRLSLVKRNSRSFGHEIRMPSAGDASTRFASCHFACERHVNRIFDGVEELEYFSSVERFPSVHRYIYTIKLILLEKACCEQQKDTVLTVTTGTLIRPMTL